MANLNIHIQAESPPVETPLLNSKHNHNHTQQHQQQQQQQQGQNQNPNPATDLDQTLQKLETFLSFLGFSQSSVWSFVLSWSAFIFIGVLLPVVILELSNCPGCEKGQVKNFELVIVASQSCLAAVSLLCFSFNFRKYGIRRFLFVDRYSGQLARFRNQYIQQIKGYIVLNRPWAFVQWLEKATIEEEYILMAEPDHLFVNPLSNLARRSHPAGFPFFYIKPAEHEKIIRKFYPEEKGPVNKIDPIGNSPVIIKKSLLEDISPTWLNVSLRMKDDPQTDKAFGWVLEMYAYAVASALHDVRHVLRKDFMLQPPWDLEVGKSFIIHWM